MKILYLKYLEFLSENILKALLKNIVKLFCRTYATNFWKIFCWKFLSIFDNLVGKNFQKKNFLRAFQAIIKFEKKILKNFFWKIFRKKNKNFFFEFLNSLKRPQKIFLFENFSLPNYQKYLEIFNKKISKIFFSYNRDQP